MKSITMHNLDPDLAKAIEEMAAATGLSQNKTVKKLLRQALGMETRPEPKPDFSKFCGLWSDQETEEFNEAISDFDQIDE
jgi:hypothetical protein